MERTYRVGTRTSPLALKQVEEVLVMLRRFYPGMRSEVIGIDTYGDKDKVTPVSDIEGTDFFTREIDEALLKNEIDPSTSLRVNGERSRTIDPSTSLRVNGERSRTIDFAVHSAKDLPDELRDGLVISALTECLDPYDALVSKSGLTLDRLLEGARIGTSSLRRKAQLKAYRKDFEIVDVRGNIEERLRLLDDNHPSRTVGNGFKPFPTQLNLDAIVIAACGLIRLGLSHRITQKIPLEILRPHPLQGSLAIVARATDLELIKLLSVLNGARHQCRAPFERF